ncbi:hypothetical protein [Streptomyces cucumeris]|uniref:hypothetical protein n=1 Tax=Streptomyces cucumeris TaxID=2962890 RepID=UPI0020C8C4AD|nr:hypothetical protein [Streptomyces sp. NEAU-Y11]MCP9213531.1 hypothetical protein [Streptomyces sp. NEAU-Y11]
MDSLDGQGVDVARLLADAAGVGVDQAVAAVLATAPASAVGASGPEVLPTAHR